MNPAPTPTQQPRPSVGRTVLYVLSRDDAIRINLRAGRAGTEGDRANLAAEGDVLPMVIVRVWPGTGSADPDPAVNGQVLIDGTFTLWVTSRHSDAARIPGTWHWPEIPGRAASPAA